MESVFLRIIDYNLIINRNKGTAADVIQLISRAKEQVKRQFGVLLEEEIVRIGEF